MLAPPTVTLLDPVDATLARFDTLKDTSCVE